MKLFLPAPITSFRSFSAFEASVKNTRKKRGLEMIPEWYESPVFSFASPTNLLGHGGEVRKPAETQELDYELGWAVVIGREGGDIAVADADSYIQGFTIVNDWTLRDIQRREQKVGLGLAKSKDFATSVGPALVTPDALEDRVLETSHGKRYDLIMEVYVNGERRGRGSTRDMHWTFAELIAAASRNTTLKPGDLISSGCVGTGCLAEFPEGSWPWLQVGDVVRLEIECLGVLENKIV
jgi:fumarylacetoacetate (FAA) hydrolase